MKLRALWFLEKVAQNEQLMKKKTADGTPLCRVVFQSVGEQFAVSEEFVLNYQFLKTIHKYIKMIDLKQAYPDKYHQLIVLFMQKTAEMIKFCNEETVHVPLEGLAFLSKVSLLNRRPSIVGF